MVASINNQSLMSIWIEYCARSFILGSCTTDIRLCVRPSGGVQDQVHSIRLRAPTRPQTHLRVLPPGRVIEAIVIGVALLLLAIVTGGWVQDSSRAEAFTRPRTTW
jgi:hypothetical protein